jgi:hypothetical protein
MNFFTSFNKDVTPVTDLSKISYHYLITNFMLDFVAIVPGLVTLELVKPLYYLKLLRFVNLNKFFDQIKYILLKLDKVLTFLNKTTVEKLLVVCKTLFAILYLIHILACLWILIGSEENGWWKNDDKFRGEYDYLEVYPISVYFITTTLSTVGYGEFVPKQSIEIIIVMVLELMGLAVFSYVLGVLSSIRGQKSFHRIITKKQEEIEQFLNDLNEVRKDINIPLEVYVNSIKAIGSTYKYNVKQLFSMFGLFEHMKPITRKRLVLITLKNIYVQFKDFFWNEHLGFQASNRFIIQFVTEFESQLFLRGKVLLQRGEE